jgi:hypothetical protein
MDASTIWQAVLLWLAGLVPWIAGLFAFAFVDLVGGLLVAFRVTKDFSLEKVPDFLKNFVVYLWMWLSVEIVFFAYGLSGIEIQGFNELMQNVAPKVVYGFFALKFLTSIIGHVMTAKDLPPVFFYTAQKVGIQATDGRSSPGVQELRG